MQIIRRFPSGASVFVSASLAFGNPPPTEPPTASSRLATTLTVDVRPSLSLQPFLDTNLECILAPLGEPAFAQSETLTNMTRRQ